MKVGRMSFACCADNAGRRIFAIGGVTTGRKATDICEMYNVDGAWVTLADLPEPRFSSSLCMFNDEWLYNFGGYDKNGVLTNTIERLNGQHQNGWETLTTRLPMKASFSGIF